MKKIDNSEISTLLLAAGKGARLGTLTKNLPKCLMPINERPILEYWLDMLHSLNIKYVLVNLHHHSEKVIKFLRRERFKNWVKSVYEKELLGTAGTIRKNYNFFRNKKLLLIHVDNFCLSNFNEFVSFHLEKRPMECPITMMTFQTNEPENCGIVKIDKKGILKSFHEKVNQYHGNLANGAVYLLEPEVIDWIYNNSKISDFSNDVIPNFIGKIATWHNKNLHIDIGSPKNLLEAQKKNKKIIKWTDSDEWQKSYLKNNIHSILNQSKV